MRDNRGQDSSKQGLVLISMSQTLNDSSTIKSSPNISKLCYLLDGDIFKATLLIASIATSLIFGMICLSKEYFLLG